MIISVLLRYVRFQDHVIWLHGPRTKRCCKADRVLPGVRLSTASTRWQQEAGAIQEDYRKQIILPDSAESCLRITLLARCCKHVIRTRAAATQLSLVGNQEVAEPTWITSSATGYNLALNIILIRRCARKVYATSSLKLLVQVVTRQCIAAHVFQEIDF